VSKAAWFIAKLSAVKRRVRLLGRLFVLRLHYYVVASSRRSSVTIEKDVLSTVTRELVGEALGAVAVEVEEPAFVERRARRPRAMRNELLVSRARSWASRVDQIARLADALPLEVLNSPWCCRKQRSTAHDSRARRTCATWTYGTSRTRPRSLPGTEVEDASRPASLQDHRSSVRSSR